MSRKTVPILLSSIAVLFLALVVIIVMLLVSDQDRKIASSRRRNAVSTLLARNVEAGDRMNNLAGIAAYVSSPLVDNGPDSGRGSLANLFHYLSKDPGRREFLSSSDRNRAADYLEGSSVYRFTGAADVPSWVPEYLGSVDWLFDSVKSDVFQITGYPDRLTSVFDIPESPGHSATRYTEKAMERFAATWIPAGETAGTYDLDRKQVRDWLVGSRKFNRRLVGLDGSWKSLTASLYNLSHDSNWQTAVAYEPRLEEELDELIVMVLAADIHHRSRDMMILVEDAFQDPDMAVSPGIAWSPEFSNYKNIPELTGYTADDIPVIFFAKVSVTYTFRDGRTQTWLNRRKDWLSDYFQTFFSTTVKTDYSPDPDQEEYLKDWAAARLKARAVHGINRKIVVAMPFGKKKVYGVRDVSFVRVNLMANP